MIVSIRWIKAIIPSNLCLWHVLESVMVRKVIRIVLYKDSEIVLFHC